jgi:TRAP transporter TAXI family solute receptor
MANAVESGTGHDACHSRPASLLDGHQREETEMSNAMRSMFVAAVIALLPAVAGAQQKLLIGSTSSSSSHYGYFVAVSQIINQKAKDVSSSVVETGATLDNLRRMDRKQVDLGLVTTNVMHNAATGQGDFAGKALNAKLLWVYSIAPQNVVVRADAGVKMLPDLNGKRLNPGIKGSATEKTAESVFKVLGITPDYMRGSTGEAVDSIKDNRIVGYVKSGAGLALDASSREIATFTPISIIGLQPAERQKLEKAMPEVSIVDVPAIATLKIPAYTTWGFGVGAAAGPEMSEETAYQIVKAICEDQEVQANAFAEVKGVNLVEMTLKYGTTPLHPGAARYFRERGAQIPDRLTPTK